MKNHFLHKTKILLRYNSYAHSSAKYNATEMCPMTVSDDYFSLLVNGLDHFSLPKVKHFATMVISPLKPLNVSWNNLNTNSVCLESLNRVWLFVFYDV